jgi:para-aminobenzoate synthetase / 4-amino-4-deoxychorismate lyase
MSDGQNISVGSVLLPADDTRESGGWSLFRSPRAIISCCRIDEVLPCVEEAERAVAGGRHVAGFIAYEAAPALDDALVTHPPGNLPLLWFGIYDRPELLETLPPASAAAVQSSSWRPELDEDAYRLAVAKIKDYIAAGHTYQVNLTQRLRSRVSIDSYALFRLLYRVQPVPYAAYLDLGRYKICCLSPELFFQVDGRRIVGRPMKGTARRGRWWAEDQQQAGWLIESAKDRAENAMIVDMIRNDMGRIAERGSVQVESVFDVDRYRTLFQMTSTVAARTDASVSAILQALFPCASVTGAPKVRTMEIIRELEAGPRGVYTGSIGWISPGRRALFNVAIRTAVIDAADGQAEYGTGSGVTWDSLASSESRECSLKTSILKCDWPSFSLLETMLWSRGRYHLLDLHLDRLKNTAEYFGYRLDVPMLRQKLAESARCFPHPSMRVRLLSDEDGQVHIEGTPFEIPRPRPIWSVAIAAGCVDSSNPFLYHKTTHRSVYEEARGAVPGFDDVLLWNELGEITESTIANVVVRLGRRLVTPPVSAGLLPGVFRERLLQRGVIREQSVPLGLLRPPRPCIW